MESLKLCSGCRRHVLMAEVACPFCGADFAVRARAGLYAAAAVAAAAGLAVTATTVGCVYGTDPAPWPDAGQDAGEAVDASTDDSDSGS